MSSRGAPPLPTLVDHAQREHSLAIGESFLVQAPAGSGKTELLIQRLLSLLASVDAPENVLAVTFTRKAAAEMRQRLIESLGPEPPAEPHKRRAWDLARVVLERDARLNWGLRQQPARLRVETLDALASRLAARMPWLTRFGPAPRPATDVEADALYRQAARRALSDGSPAAELLLRFYHANCDLLETRLAELLARRDQWPLEKIGDRAHLRAAIEEELREIRSAMLHRVGEAIAALGIGAQLVRLARECAADLPASELECELGACLDLRALPRAAESDWLEWRGIVYLLLTNGGTPRKQLGGKLGFPSDAKRRKETFRELVLALSPELCASLQALRSPPPATMTDREWATVNALLELMPQAAAALRREFAAAGKVDFIALTKAATEALGEEHAPTDLAFALDGTLRHILIDEFQDTAPGQLRLLQHLIGDWRSNDGRTLFAVGDPMQSLYGFRNADVRIFLNAAKDREIAGLRLETPVLQTNFRSRPELVRWCNDAFAPDPPFAPATPVRTPGGGVRLHRISTKEYAPEAALIVNLVREELKAIADDHKAQIAILVASRRHTRAILPALQRAGIGFEAVKLLGLTESPVVQDLLALTRALLHPGDRVAWLSLLRAPWCGLTLADLHALCHDSHNAGILECLCDPQRLARLSADGQTRAAALRDALAPALDHRLRAPLRALVEWCWQRLGGEACIADPVHTAHPAAFFRLLENPDLDYDRLDTQAEKLKLAPMTDVSAHARVVVLTIHQAKGLQFDTVILPGMGRSTRGDDPRLLAWEETDAGRVLLSALPPETPKEPPLHAWLRRVANERRRQEQRRQLYVAATRAERKLHLLAHLTKDGEAHDGSPLARIWLAIRDQFPTEPAVVPPPTSSAVESAPPLRRAPAGWRPPAPPAGVAWSAPPPPRASADSAAHADGVQRAVGIAVHALLQRLAQKEEMSWDPARLEALLRAAGLDGAALREANARASRALRATLDDPRGQWILAARREAGCEVALAGMIDGETRHGVLDRTFVDEEGVRWVIDYKMAAFAGRPEAREPFLDAQCELYREQLDTYAALLAALRGGEVRRGLYFPLLTAWRQW